MNGVKLTESQRQVLLQTRWQCDTTGRMLPLGGQIRILQTLEKLGLANRAGEFALITPALRAWLAENTKDER